MRHHGRLVLPGGLQTVADDSEQRAVPQVGVREVGGGECSPTQRRSAQIAPDKPGAVESGLPQVGAEQVAARQISVAEVGPAQACPRQVETRQVAPCQHGIRKVAELRIAAPAIGTRQFATIGVRLLE